MNPQGINPDYHISSLDPCLNITRPSYYQSVYSCSGFPIEPYQQLFPYQSGTFIIFSSATLYEAEIISGTDYAYFERVEYSDSAGNFYPYETFGTLLTGLTGAELSGTGDYIGYEGPGTFERENSSVYRVHFDNYSESEASVIIRIKNLNDNTFTDWHTLIVNPDLRFVNQQYEADTLLHYYSKEVTPQLRNNNSPCSHPGNGGCPPDNVTFNIEVIEGQQYGSIKNAETNETATSFTGLSYNNLFTTFTYYANGVQPDSSATVKIRHSSSDAEIIPIEFSFAVKKNNIPPPSEGGSIYVKMDKKVVIPGDTVNVQLMWINEVSDTIEFTQLQSFIVDLAEGGEFGTILDAATGDTSDTFTEITNEFKVIVNPQITQQQAKIVIVAEADLIIFTRPLRINNGTNTTKQIQKNTLDKNDEQEGTNTDLIIIGNHLVGVGEITITKTPFIIEIDPPTISAGDTARIIPKKLNPDGTTTFFDSLQTFELGMLDGCVLGKLSNAGIDTNYFYGVTQPFYFIADTSADSGSVSIRVGVIDMNQQNRSLTNNNTNIENDNPVSCANVNFVENLYVNKSLVLGDLIEINYVKGDKFITEFPKMPEILFTARPKFQLIGPYNLVWELEVKWIDKRDSPDRITKEIFRGDETGFGNPAVLWSVPWDAKIIGGDKIKITASIVYGGYLYTASKNLDIRVIGENPTPAEIKSGLSLFEQIIVYKESWPKWKHFNESGSLNGFPIWGWPHGYGLMQIDNPSASDEEIWNWKKNVDAGKRLIQDKKSIFADDRYEKVIKKYSAANYYSDNELMMQLWQLYNGGFYYKWKPDFPKKKNSTGKWVKDNPPIVKGHEKPYAEEAWEIYDGIINGNYPIDWGN
ncbi:MAG: hypothetical protein ABI638_06615 [Ignavibacteriota bacterium]